MNIKNKREDRIFEFIYSIFILIFGLGIIFFFIGILIFAAYQLGILFLIFFSPVLIGVYYGIFSKHREYEMEIDPKDCKKLDDLINKMAKKTGVRRPHKIVLREGSGVAVTGFFKKKIIIGLVAINYLDEEELLAIISHEYGHFAHRDTVFGYLTFRIQNFIEIQKNFSFENIKTDLSALIHLPTLILFYPLSKYYNLINLWYSRRIEFRADAFAAQTVGNQKFAEALVKYCVISDMFHAIVPAHVIHFLKENKKIVNIYDYMSNILTGKENKEKGFQRVLSEKSTLWDTHPSISERLERLKITDIDFKINGKSAMLLHNQHKYEEAASDIVTNSMHYTFHVQSAYDGVR